MKSEKVRKSELTREKQRLIWEVLNMANYTGVVKWFDNERGYGFLSTNDGQDVFVHHSQVKEKTHSKDLHEGETVNFDVRQSEKGLSALNVHKI